MLGGMNANVHPGVAEAIAYFGGQKLLGQAAGAVGQTTVHEWLTRRRPVPPSRAATIERASKGALRAEALSSGENWVRVKCAGWPWNGGKPLIDPLP